MLEDRIDTLGVSGHRPFLWDYDPKVYSLLSKITIDRLEILSPGIVLTGMALGFDTIVAESCIALGLPFVAVIPWVGQPQAWKDVDRDRYNHLVEKSSKVVIVSEELDYRPSHFLERNRYIVERSDHMLILWNGVPSGGTYDAVRRSNETGIKKTNIFAAYKSHRVESSLRPS